MTERLDKLSDITRCRCTLLTCQEANCGCNNKGCNNSYHINCRCAREVKIPAIELGFIRSQRLKSGELGGMQMMREDVPATMRQISRTARKEKKRTRKERGRERRETAMAEERATQEAWMAEAVQENCEAVDDSEAGTSQDQQIQGLADESEEHDQGAEHTIPRNKRNMVGIPLTALAAIRYSVSNTAAAAVARGYVYDLIKAEMLTKDMALLAVDRKKVHRARNLVMKHLQKSEHKSEEKIDCILFDSRIDTTKVRTYDEETRRSYVDVVNEDHYSLTDEDGRYLDHFTKERQEADANVSSSEQVAKSPNHLARLPKLVCAYITHFCVVTSVYSLFVRLKALKSVPA